MGRVLAGELQTLFSMCGEGALEQLRNVKLIESVHPVPHGVSNMATTTNVNLDLTSPADLSAKCGRCGTILIGAEWSENLADGGCVHIWQCPVCSYEFETMDNAVEKTESDAELVEEFLPNLLVA